MAKRLSLGIIYIFFKLRVLQPSSSITTNNRKNVNKDLKFIGGGYRLAAPLSRCRDIPLVPKGDSVTGAYFLVVFKETSRSGNHSTGESVTKSELVKCTNLLFPNNFFIYFLPYEMLTFSTQTYFTYFIPSRSTFKKNL